LAAPVLTAATNVAGTVAVTNRNRTSGTFNVPDNATITRTDGKTWQSDGFAINQAVTITGVPGTRTVTGFNATGSAIFVKGGALPTGSSVSLAIGVVRLGGDAIVLSGPS